MTACSRLLVFSLASSALCLAAAPVASSGHAPPTAHAVILSGLGGSTQYSRLLADWTARFHAVLTKQCGVPAENVVVLTETEDAKATPPRQKATVENFRAAMEKAAKALRPKDQLILFMAGHGQINEESGKLCLPGTDLKASELGDLLDALPAEQIVIINAASGGADFLKAILRPGRVILTAAGYETEGTQTYFAEFLLRGLETGPLASSRYPADANADKAVDLLEAYAYGARETVHFYHRQYLVERPDLGKDVKPTLGKVYWLVRGKETRAAWKRLYADTDNLLARPQPERNEEGKIEDKLPADLDAEPDPTPKFGRYGEHWRFRRLLAEHARLDDTGVSKRAFFLWKPYEFEEVPKDPKPGETGYLARHTILGRPAPAR